MAWVEHDYPDAATLAAGVAEALESACRAALAAHGTAFLALAGGRTPLPAYERLAAAELRGRIALVPTDERCVAHDHPACNLRALRAAFAPQSAHGASFQVNALTREDGDAAASLAFARDWLAAHPQRFDAVLLGMGGDGHVASLFPGADNLEEGLAPDSLQPVIALRPDPMPAEAPFERISLTLARLLHARAVHLAVSGMQKREVLARAQREPRGALPVAHLLHATATTVHLHWSP